MNDDGSETTEALEGETVDVAEPGRALVGATRGEIEIEIGAPSDRPDHAEVTVRRKEVNRGDTRRGETGIVLSVDVSAGDLGSGHADVTLSDEEADVLADLLRARS